MSDEVTAAGRAERFKPFCCDQCGSAFEPRNRNGIVKRFCSRACKTAWHNQERQRLYNERHHIRRKAPSPGKRQVLLGLIPPAERPALLLAAAVRLGLTEESAAVSMARATGVQEIEAA